MKRFDVRIVFGLMLIVGGLIVGIGTRLGRGCTSGHGICGLSRLSPRSGLAVAIFMATAMQLKLPYLATLSLMKV